MSPDSHMKMVEKNTRAVNTPFAKFSVLSGVLLKRSKNLSPSAVRRPTLPFVVRPWSAVRPPPSAFQFS